MSNFVGRDILYKEKAREMLTRGVDKVAEAVKVTLGPKGHAVVFSKMGKPNFSLDGVTVAKQIRLEDEAENFGAQLAIDIASKSDKKAGDGTTTATILAQSILKQGLKALTAGIDHTRMKKGVDKALEMAKESIKSQSKEVSSKEDLASVATISSRDKEVGRVVAEVVHELGKDAVITVEEGKVVGLFKEMVEGMKLDKGLFSPYFITSRERMNSEFENPYILVTDAVISENDQIYNSLKEVLMSDKREIVIFCSDLKGEALMSLIRNHLEGKIKIAVVKAPGIGDDKQEQLGDIAELVGATYISENTGIKLNDATVNDMGTASRVITDQNETIIVGGKGDIKERVKGIKLEIENVKSEYKKELAEQRLAKLTGQIAVIKAGSLSEQENAELRYRIEDAVRSAKSALEEGIVGGGGMALMLASEEIENDVMENINYDMAFRTGLEIVAEAMQEPARQIILNSGEKPDVVLQKTASEKKGYNANTGEYVDLKEAGIIDPAKVVRTGLENAVSIASMFLITDAVIIDKKEEDKKDE